MITGPNGLQIIPHQPPAGAPFTPTSADNGLSVDGTGKIVLGNTVGDAAAPAQLLSTREIKDNGLFLRFVDNPAAPVVTSRLNSGLLQFFDAGSGLVANVAPNGIAASSLAGAQSFMSAGAINVQDNGIAHLATLAPRSLQFDISAVPAQRIVIINDIGILQFMDIAAVAWFDFDISNGNYTCKGSITSGDPGSGTAQLFFGTVIAAASAFDATRYWEIKNNGVVVKVALVV